MVPHSKGYGMVAISLLGFERGRQSYVLLRENQKQPVPFFDLINARLALSYTIFFFFFLLQAWWCEILEESRFEELMKAKWVFGLTLLT